MRPKLKVGILFNAPFKPERGEDVDYLSEAGVLEEVDHVEEALSRIGLTYKVFPVGGEISLLIKDLKEYQPDVVVNLCEGVFGDSYYEMHIPAMLELLGIPYTGSGPLTLGLCQDKGLAKAVLKSYGIPTPRYRVVGRFEDWRGGLNYPLIVKPVREDGSVGISRRSFVRSEEELRVQVEYVTGRYRQPALVEEYVAGREFNVAILEVGDPVVLPVLEIIFDSTEEPKIRDYSAKWLKESEEYRRVKPVCPADVEPGLRDRIGEIALRVYRLFRCRDYARIDMRMKGGTPYVLEVNPNPDISRDSAFVRSLKAAGIPFEEFIKNIILSALRRSGKLYQGISFE